MNAIAKAPKQASAVALAEAPNSLLNVVAAALHDPSVDVAKLEALLRMQRDLVADEARLAFNRAMNAVQSEMAPVVRDAENKQTRSRYARLETIDAIIRPIYSSHGFSLSFNSLPIEDGRVRLACEVAHEGGFSRSYQLDAALDTAGPNGNANKTPLHGLGSSLTYLRRYLTCLIFNIVLANQDTDGNRPSDTGELLTRPQLDELRVLMKATNTQEARFLAAMRPGLRSLAESEAAGFAQLKTALLSKQAMLAKKAQSQVVTGAAA